MIDSLILEQISPNESLLTIVLHDLALYKNKQLIWATSEKDGMIKECVIFHGLPTPPIRRDDEQIHL
jgi:hypothetical protein